MLFIWSKWFITYSFFWSGENKICIPLILFKKKKERGMKIEENGGKWRKKASKWFNPSNL